MVRIGNFFFHYRNGLFPLLYILIFLNGPAAFANHRLALLIGVLVALGGQILRAVTVGLMTGLAIEPIEIRTAQLRGTGYIFGIPDIGGRQRVLGRRSPKTRAAHPG